MAVVTSRFPVERPRRLRRTPALRRLVAETRLSVDDLVAPLFVREAISEPQPIESLPGVVQHTRDSLRKESRARRTRRAGSLLFGFPRPRRHGSEAWNTDGIVQLARRRSARRGRRRLVVIADLCLDEYTRSRPLWLWYGPTARSTTTPTIELYARVSLRRRPKPCRRRRAQRHDGGQVGVSRRARRRELSRCRHPRLRARSTRRLLRTFRDAVDVRIVGGGDRRATTGLPTGGSDSRVRPTSPKAPTS